MVQVDRSSSFPAFPKSHSFLRQRSDVLVIRSLSTNVLQEHRHALTLDDSKPEEQSVPEEEAVCRICMLELDEGNGTFKMECSCKGELALAHEDCAVKWFNIKGNNLCDICNSIVCNLPVFVFCRTSSLHWDNESVAEDEVIDESSSWLHAAVIILSSALATLWQKLEELSEFP